MLSTSQVLAALDGRITYRQLDWWIRTRRITLDDNPRGSGSHRAFTPVEVAALREFIDLYERSRQVDTWLADGTLWAQLVAKHRPHLVEEVPA